MSKKWTPPEEKQLIDLKQKGLSDYDIAERMGRTFSSVNVHLNRMKHSKALPISHIPESSLPLWDKPLQSEGDALILSDIEAPFQHAEFINRCLDLADGWGIQALHLAGDLMHYDSLSAWGSEWVQDKEELLDAVMAVVEEFLKNKDKAAIYNRLQEKGLVADGSLSGELKESRAVFRSFNSFQHIYVALGNHDDRYLRALDLALSPNELLRQMDTHNDPRWKIAPYYYTLIETGQGVFRAEHPRNSGKNAAIDLATQFHQHVVMGHSHRWSINRDPSGKFWAIQTGHCVDEKRLAYVQQRSAKRDAHVLGATIIRDGYPFVLSPETRWDLMRRM